MENQKTYEFRDLKATDLTLILKLISKIGLDNFTKAFDDGFDKFIEIQLKNDKNNENNNVDKKEEFTVELGKALFNIAQVIIERLSVCEDEIMNLLESCSNLSKAEIKDMNLIDYIKMIKDFVKLKEFKELFTLAVSFADTAN